MNLVAGSDNHDVCRAAQSGIPVVGDVAVVVVEEVSRAERTADSQKTIRITLEAVSDGVLVADKVQVHQGTGIRTKLKR